MKQRAAFVYIPQTPKTVPTRRQHPKTREAQASPRGQDKGRDGLSPLSADALRTPGRRTRCRPFDPPSWAAESSGCWASRHRRRSSRCPAACSAPRRSAPPAGCGAARSGSSCCPEQRFRPTPAPAKTRETIHSQRRFKQRDRKGADLVNRERGRGIG